MLLQNFDGEVVQIKTPKLPEESEYKMSYVPAESSE